MNKNSNDTKNKIFEIIIIGFCVFGILSSILNIVMGIRYGIINIIIAGIVILIIAMSLLIFYIKGIRKYSKNKSKKEEIQK